MNVYRFEIGDSVVVKKKEKKERKIIRAKQNRINRIRLIKHSKIPNYKISSSRLY